MEGFVWLGCREILSVANICRGHALRSLSEQVGQGKEGPKESTFLRPRRRWKNAGRGGMCCADHQADPNLEFSVPLLADPPFIFVSVVSIEPFRSLFSPFFYLKKIDNFPRTFAFQFMYLYKSEKGLFESNPFLLHQLTSHLYLKYSLQILHTKLSQKRPPLPILSIQSPNLQHRIPASKKSFYPPSKQTGISFTSSASKSTEVQTFAAKPWNSRGKR